MKTIGLIGGMSWESTIPYYQIINEAVRDRLGGLHSAKLILHSVEFDEIEKCQTSGNWEKSGKILGHAAQGLEAAGADFILICTNTMHKVAPQVAAMVHVPLLHIADATADALERDGIRRVALLGTKYTMTQDFYKQRLIDRGTENEESLRVRLGNVAGEVEQAYNYDYVIINQDWHDVPDSLDIATEEVYSIIKAKRCAKSMRKAFLDSLTESLRK